MSMNLSGARSDAGLPTGDFHSICSCPSRAYKVDPRLREDDGRGGFDFCDTRIHEDGSWLEFCNILPPVLLDSLMSTLGNMISINRYRWAVQVNL